MSIFGNLFKHFNVNYYESDKLYKAFDVKPCISDFERDLISDWRDIYIDKAPWLTDGGSYNINTLETYLHGGNEILRSLGFAKSICEEIARLSTLELNIEVIGSGRATYIQTNYIDDLKNDLQNIIELMAAVGFVVLKPGIDDTDLITPFDLIPIRYDKKKLNEVIFIDKIERDNDILIRCEHHNYIDEEKYIIRNKAFLSKDKSFDMQEIPLNSIPEWSEIKEEVNLKGLEHPLYVVLSMPTANNIDIHSKIAMSCFSGVTQQLEDLDVAYTNFAHEVYNSNKVMFLSQFVIDNTKAKRTKLPDFVKGLEFGVGAENTVQEFNPEILVDKRREQINLLLSFIGYKCGFSNGYFQFNEKTGLVTATQIEADQQRTINTITSIRTMLEYKLNELIECINYLCDIYGLVGAGEYETSYYFKDITANFEEDRSRNIELVKLNILPKWKYLQEFEGYTEEEAKQMVKEANADGGSQMQDDYGNQMEQLKEQYQKGDKVVEAETEEPHKGINEK